MSVPRVGAAAPSGIPVASTDSIRVTGAGLNNRLFPKTNDVEFAGGVGYYNSLYPPEIIRFDGIWKFQDFYYFDDSLTITDMATNPSTDPNYIPTTGWSPRLDQPLGGSPAITTITAVPSGLPVATTNTITLLSGASGPPTYIADGATFPKQNIGRFGDYLDYKLVWSGSRWEMLGDNDGVTFYNTTPGQTTNYFPDQGNWFNFFDQPASLVFVGS